MKTPLQSCFTVASSWLNKSNGREEEAFTSSASPPTREVGFFFFLYNLRTTQADFSISSQFFKCSVRQTVLKEEIVIYVSETLVAGWRDTRMVLHCLLIPVGSGCINPPQPLAPAPRIYQPAAGPLHSAGRQCCWPQR